MPESTSGRNKDRIDAALAHLGLGFAAFSVWSTESDGTCRCPQGKACISPGKHPIPRDGFKSASTDPEIVKTMLIAGSEPNYGLVWADPTRILVMIDVDGPGWKARIDALIEQFGTLPPTKTTRTPSGGLHLFYFWPIGSPVPEGNDFHGFVIRFPAKGYVVGPGSRINGKVYTAVGPPEIATLPPTWLPTAPRPLITVAGDSDKPLYDIPEGPIGEGHRHDEIVRLMGSLWNKKVPLDQALTIAKAHLAPLFEPSIPEERLVREAREAYEGAEGKWERSDSAGPTLKVVGSDEEIVIDPLAIEMRADRPPALDPHTLPMPVGLAMVLDHVSPFTDASYSSLILCTLVTFSALMGPKPRLHWRGRHRTTLFGCLVGESGIGRKTTAMVEIESALQQVDPLLSKITRGGFASGEVLIDRLDGASKSGDGSILLREHELGRLLTITEREGSILSSTLRLMWDGARVETDSRKSGSVVADGYHAAVLGGITPAELSKKLPAESVMNGWANRFLWFWSEKRDYDPGDAVAGAMEPGTLAYLRDCIDFARRLGGTSPLITVGERATMEFSPAAATRMKALLAALDVAHVGAIGALRQRMPGHTARIAMVAALLDQQREIDLDHVEFGIALSQYAVDSMRAVFGVRIDDEVAMSILDLLYQAPDRWLNTSTLAKALRKDGSRVKTALRLLMAEGLITREDRKTPGGGRPSVGFRIGL